MGRIVTPNGLFRGWHNASALVIPWCTYTDPELAHVGLYEKEARGQGLNVQTFMWKLDEVDRAVLDGEESGFARVLVRKGSDKILGATIVRSEEHTSELQSHSDLVCRLLLEKKKKQQ